MADSCARVLSERGREESGRGLDYL